MAIGLVFMCPMESIPSVLTYMRITLVDNFGPFLTTAQAALKLCADIANTWNDENVELDFNQVVQMSPSFSNALILNLLNQVSVDELVRRMSIVNAEAHILDQVNRTIARKVEHQAALSNYFLESA